MSGLEPILYRISGLDSVGLEVREAMSGLEPKLSWVSVVDSEV